MRQSAPEYPPPGYFLRVKNWDDYFERAQTRKVPSPLSWIALPTKHDGCKFRKLIRTKRGITIFGSFCLLLEVAAKMPKRGDFVRHDLSTLTCSDFEAITGADRRTFKAAIETLLLPEFGWLELVACSQDTTIVVSGRSYMREEKKREREREEETPRAEGWSDHPAVELYRVRFRPEEILAIPVQEQIEYTVGNDIQGWTETLDYWQGNGYRPRSVAKMLERYREQKNGRRREEEKTPWDGAI